jgi:23S rRNA (pseudouridine1915-N3)-methyltransferase
VRINLLAVGTRMPDWVDAGCDDFIRRLPPEWGFALKQIPAHKSRSSNRARRLEQEGQGLLAAAPKAGRLIALHERGSAWSSADLAARIADWSQAGGDVALMIGGPDGLAASCTERAEELWSLSRLTFPHALVRVIVVEQLYRAAMILRRHPYHR